jgi:hypothetical protein
MRPFVAALVIIALIALDRAYFDGQNTAYVVSLIRRAGDWLDNRCAKYCTTFRGDDQGHQLQWRGRQAPLDMVPFSRRHQLTAIAPVAQRPASQ